MSQRENDNNSISRRALLRNAAAVAGAGLVSSITTATAGAAPKPVALADEPIIKAPSSKLVVETTAGKVSFRLQ
jgi:hypothetical protein